MVRSFRFNVIFAIAFVLICGVTNWFMTSEGSPIYWYLLDHISLSNVWTVIHLIPRFISTLASGNVHGFDERVFYAVAAVQWSFTGFALSLLFVRPRSRTQPHAV
jgi:hypothetical protein